MRFGKLMIHIESSTTIFALFASGCIIPWLKVRIGILYRACELYYKYNTPSIGIQMMHQMHTSEFELPNVLNAPTDANAE